jgi:hypothetical protein
MSANRAFLRRIAVSLMLFIPGAALLAYAYRHAPGTATITVDASKQYQTIRGWEATAEAGLDERPTATYLEELTDAGVALGLTRLRVEVRSSYEHTRDIEREYRDGRMSAKDWRCARYSTVNDNNDPEVIDPNGFQFGRLDGVIEGIVLPFKRRVEETGERFVLNVNYVAFTNEICDGLAYAHDDPREYAELVVAVYRHLRDKYSLTPDRWEVALEPDNTRIWTGDRMGKAMAQTAIRLQKEGFTPAFVAPSTTQADNALRYFDEIWSHKAVRPFFRELSYHRYREIPGGTIEDIGKEGEKRGIETAMLEKIDAGYDELAEDLLVGRNSVWQQYVLGYPEPDTGAHYLIVAPEAPPGKRITLSKTAQYLRQYFRAIRPDALRLGATTDNRDFQPIAVRNRHGGVAVVVATARPGEVTIQRLEAGTYKVSCWTDASRSDAPADRCTNTVNVGASGTLVATLPGAGVLSVEATPPAARP